jgi:hypothetical protein
MRYSLINVSNDLNGLISGYWLIDKFGTLKEVKKYALETSAINKNIDIAVVDLINRINPGLNFYVNLKRL